MLRMIIRGLAAWLAPEAKYQTLNRFRAHAMASGERCCSVWASHDKRTFRNGECPWCKARV